MQFILKAKKSPIGTISSWKTGKYIKDSEHHWKLLTEIVHSVAKEAGAGPHDDEAKLLHEMSVSALNHIKDHPNPSLSTLREHLDQHDNDEYEDFNGFKNAVKHVLSKYVEEHKKLKPEPKEEPKKEAVPPVKTKEEKGVHFTDVLLYQKACSSIKDRKTTSSRAQSILSQDEIEHADARLLLGHTLDINGVVGVANRFWYQKMSIITDDYLKYGGRRKFVKGKVVQWQLVTKDGVKKVTADHANTRIVADPTGPADHEIKAGGEIGRAGIHSLIFGDDVPTHTQNSWRESIEFAFKQLNYHLGLNFHGKVKIHIYGKGFNRRNAVADYNPRDKIVRMSVKKDKSAEALAHELGHAFEDKLEKWYGEVNLGKGYNTTVNSVVNEFKRTKQYSREQAVLTAYANMTDMIGNRVRAKRPRWYVWASRPEEIFARCFETYIAKKVPKWEEMGWAKRPIHEDSFAEIERLFDEMFKNKEVLKALGEVMDMEKAKKLVVGTIRKWADGRYIKENEHHWKLLEDVTHKIAADAGVKKNHPEAKLLHKMAMSAVKHIKGHENPSKSAMHEHLDKHDDGTYENFEGLKSAVEHVLSQYVAEHKTLKTGKGEAQTKTGQKQQSWAERLEEQKGKLSEAKLDIWVGAQFLKAKKPILHLLVAAREILRGKENVDPSRGFDGLCHVILTRAYERGPDAFQPETLERFTKAFHTYFEKVTATEKSPSTDSEDKIEQLLKKTPYYQEHEEWFRYCVHRMMEKNGAVSYSGLKPYMQNAMKKYNGVVPNYGQKKVKVARKKLVVKRGKRA